MADLEERPSKIRKLEPPAESNESSQSNSGDPEPSEVARTESNDPPKESEVLGEVPPLNAGRDGKDQPTLSKSQMKKLRKAAEWEAGREYRKAKRREKHKEKKARKAGQRGNFELKIVDGGPTRDLQKKDEENLKRPRRPIQVPVAFILDCSFNNLMMDKEIISLGAQLTRCYSDNRKNPYRAHLALSSWGGTLRSRFETVLTNNHLSWKGVKFFEEDFVIATEKLDEVMKSKAGGVLAGALVKEIADAMETEPTVDPSVFVDARSKDSKATNTSPQAVMSKIHETSQSINEETTTEADPTVEPKAELGGPLKEGNPHSDGDDDLEEENADSSPPKQPQAIVYLTSDSPHTLQHLSPNTSYIIGGIVDKNRHKGLCYKRACEMGIPTAKLPIGEYMTMQSRTVLAVNHVVEIMLKWLVTGDWGEAFLSVIPKRKEAKLKTKKGEEKQGEEDDSEDEAEGETSLLDIDAVEASETPEAEIGEDFGMFL